jgi:hypothetical protein
MPESIMFAVMEVKVRDKRAGRSSTITLESANAKGVSKVVLTGDEEDAKLYRVGEFYTMTLAITQAPAQA